MFKKLCRANILKDWSVLPRIQKSYHVAFILFVIGGVLSLIFLTDMNLRIILSVLFGAVFILTSMAMEDKQTLKYFLSWIGIVCLDPILMFVANVNPLFSKTLVFMGLITISFFMISNANMVFRQKIQNQD